MAYSDRVILEALREQLEQRGPDCEISHTELGDACGASRATVQRSIKRLMNCGKVSGVRRTRGYQYRICDDSGS